MIFCYLEKNKLLENTSVVITADHGFSYYFNPIREKYVISSYKENYNVPFIIYNKKINYKNIEGFLSTKDISSTLLDLANINIPKEFKGKSLLNFDGREYSTVEYMGGGCPDLNRRPMVIGVRNNNYEVITEIFKGNIQLKEVYDVKKDSKEHRNLVNNNKIDVKKELNIIKNRYNEIIKDCR